MSLISPSEGLRALTRIAHAVFARRPIIPRARAKTTENPLKQTGANKARTRAMVDRAEPQRGRRVGAAETSTGQGGTTRGRSGRADTRHPAQRGGVTHQRDEGQRGQAGRGRKRHISRGE